MAEPEVSDLILKYMKDAAKRWGFPTGCFENPDFASDIKNYISTIFRCEILGSISGLEGMRQPSGHKKGYHL
jgi:hypothetical protein